MPKSDSTTPYIEIPLTKGMIALVDAGDSVIVLRHKWQAIRHPRTHKWYARGWIPSKRRCHALHRFLMNPPDHLHVDHINGDGLDCRRANMRLATQKQNNQNHPIHKDNKSRFKGVHFHQTKWRAQIGTNGKVLSLGCYDNIEDAARAYDQKARELFGEFAWTNFRE